MTGPADPRSVATGRPRATSQTPTTVRSRRVGAASRTAVGAEGEVPAGPAAGVRHGEPCSIRHGAVDRVGGGQLAALPGDAEDPQALAIERQGPELSEPARDAPAAGIAVRVEDLDPAHAPAGGIEPAAIGAEGQAA